MRLSQDVTPHPDGEALAEAAVRRGQRLACAVRDDGAYEVARITDDLSRDELVALAVALAAMVPLDKPAKQLLAWMDGPPARPLPEGHRFPLMNWSDTSRRLAHNAYHSGRRDQWAVEGERAYQRERGRRRRARAKEEEAA